MPNSPESNPKVENKQIELLSKLKSGKEKLGKENYGYYEGVYKAEVDAFQALETDPDLLVYQSPTAKKHFDAGSERVFSILNAAAIQGAVLSEDLDPEKKDKRKAASELLYDMAGDLSEHMKPYKEDLSEISVTERTVNGVKKNHETLLSQYGEMISEKSLSETAKSQATEGINYCGKAKNLLETFTKLPTEFKRLNLAYVNAQIQFFTTILSYQAMQQVVFEKKWENYVDITALLQTGDVLTEMTPLFYTLLPEEQNNITSELGLTKFNVKSGAEVATAPPIMQNYLMGLALFEQGRLEDAKKYLEQFSKKDLWSAAMQKHSEYWDKRFELSDKADEVLKQIDELLSDNKDFFDAQRFAGSGDIIGAKIILLKYVKEKATSKDKKTLDLIKAAKTLLRNIARAQLEELKQKFELLPLTEGKYYQDEKENLRGLGRLIESSDMADLTDIIAKKFPNLEPGHLLSDVSIEEKNRRDRPDCKAQFDTLRIKFEAIPVPPRYFTGTGRAEMEGNETPQYREYKKMEAQMHQLEQVVATTESDDLEAIINQSFPDLEPGHLFLNVTIENSGKAGLLELARKYREMGQQSIAREYYKKYFASRLTKIAQKKVTVESIRKKYDTKDPFLSGINGKVNEVVEKYKELYGKDWESMYERAGGEVRFRKEIEKQTINQIYLREVMEYQQSDTKDISAADLPIWNEFAEMEGIKERSIAGVEVAISDEDLKSLIEEITVAIIITAASAGIASATAGVVSRGIVSLAARAGMGYGSSLVASTAGGFATEGLMFSASQTTFNSIRAGNLSLNTFGEGVSSDVLHGTAVLGLFYGAGILGRAFGEGSIIAERAASGVGRGAKAAKASVEAARISQEMIAMGIVEGKLTPHAAAMVLGLKLAHSKDAQRFNERMSRRKAEALEALRRGKKPGEAIENVVSPETSMLHEGVMFEMESIGVNNPANIRNVVMGKDGKVVINGRKTLTPEEVAVMSPAYRQRVNDIIFINSLRTHGAAIFTAEGFEGATDRRAKIDENGRISYNTEFFNTKFKNLGVKLERVGGEGPEGKNVFRVGDKILSDVAFLDAKDVPAEQRAAVKKARRALLEEMIVGRTHEVIHRLGQYAFQDDPGKLMNGMRDIMGAGDKAQVVDTNGRKVQFEWTHENAEELIAMIGETALGKGQSVEVEWKGQKIKVSAEQVAALEGLIREKLKSGLVKLPREFSFRGAREVDTHLLARELPDAFARGRKAFSTAMPGLGAIDAGWHLPVAASGFSSQIDKNLRKEFAEMDRSLSITAPPKESFITLLNQLITAYRAGDIGAVNDTRIPPEYRARFDKIYQQNLRRIVKDMSQGDFMPDYKGLDRVIYERLTQDRIVINKLLEAKKTAELRKKIMDGEVEINEYVIADIVGSKVGKALYFEMFKNGHVRISVDSIKALIGIPGAMDVIMQRVRTASARDPMEIQQYRKILEKTNDPQLIMECISAEISEDLRLLIINDVHNVMTVEMITFLNKPENALRVDLLKEAIKNPKLLSDVMEFAFNIPLWVYNRMGLRPDVLIEKIGKMDTRDMVILADNAHGLNDSQIESILSRNFEVKQGGSIRIYEAAILGTGGIGSVAKGLCHIEGNPELIDIVVKRPLELKDGEDDARKYAFNREVPRSKIVENAMEVDPSLKDGFMEPIYADSELIVYKAVNERFKRTETMEDAVGDRSISDPEFNHSTAHALRYLARLHRLGLAHRDVKPANLMYVEGGSKWIDYGSLMDKDQYGSVVGMVIMEGDRVVGLLPLDKSISESNSFIETSMGQLLFYVGSDGQYYYNARMMPPGVSIAHELYYTMPKYSDGTAGQITPNFYDYRPTLLALRGEVPHTREDYPAVARTLYEFYFEGTTTVPPVGFPITNPPRNLSPPAVTKLRKYILDLLDPYSKVTLDEVADFLDNQ